MANTFPWYRETVFANDATIAYPRDNIIVGSTIYLTGTSSLSFVGDQTGLANIGTAAGMPGISYGNPTIDDASVISNDPAPPASTTLNFAGYNVSEGTLVSNGGPGSSLTINVTQNAAAPGYFLNYGDIEADPGNAVTISVVGTSELFNAGLIYANGGTVIIDGGSGIAGGYAPMLGGAAVIGSHGTLELNAGFPSGTQGSSPVFAFYDGDSGDTLILDQIGQFGGRILGFQQGDTIDLGSGLAIAAIAVTADGRVLLENNKGAVLDTLVLSSGAYNIGTFAVSGGIADGFTLTTGGDGDTLLTTDVINSVWNNTSGVWQTAADWSTNVVPGSTATAVIGLDTVVANGTISPFVLTTGSAPVNVDGLIEANNNATLQITSATTIGTSVNEYGIQQIAGEIEVTGGNTLTTTFFRQLSPSTDLQIDAGGVLDLTGHSNLGFANNGTLTETTVVNGTVFANGDTLGLFIGGTATVDGGLINAGPVFNGTSVVSTGGLISIGQNGGGEPGTMTVEAGGTVIDTYGYLSSDPTSFGALTLTGPGTTWDDVGDPTDLYNTRGYMIVGGNDVSGNGPLPSPAGTAQLVVEDSATLTEALYATIGAQPDSAGSATITSGGVWNIGTSASGGFLNVGNYGSGTLVVGSGGTVNILAGTGSFVQNGTLVTEVVNGATYDAGQGFGIAHQAGSDGTVVVDGGRLSLSLNDTVPDSGMGVGQRGHGVLDILDGGTVSITNGGLSTGSDAVTGDGTIIVGSGDGQSALLEVSSPTNPNGGGASIGKVGTGTLYVNALGTVDLRAGSLNVGRSAGSYGFVEINGGLVEDTTAGLTVGNAGTGTLELLNFGTVMLTGGGIDVGESASAQGLLEIASGGLLTSTTNGMEIGVDSGSTGTLEVLAGGIYNLSTHGISAGFGADTTGTILVDGAGALINIGSQAAGFGFDIGNSGTGFLTVENNGSVADAGVSINVGLSKGSTGTVAVTGGGQITTTGTQGIAVGGSGNGLLTIGTGGIVSAASFFNIAQNGTASTGTVVVNGGTLDSNGAFVVGQGGHGTLVVEGNGHVSDELTTTGGFSIGLDGGSSGSVIVDGGSLTESGGFFAVGGASASGSLLVEDDGVLSTTGIGLQAAVIDATGVATAAAIVSGGTWTVANGAFDIGDVGSGSLDINGGGSIGVVNAASSPLTIGVVAGSHGTVSIESGGTLIDNDLIVAVPFTGVANGVLTIGSGGVADIGQISEGQGGTITVGGGPSAAVLSSTGAVVIGQSGTGALLAIDSLGTVTGTGANTLQIENGSTVTVNGGTLGGFNNVLVGVVGAASPGTLVVTGGGTLEGAAVTVENAGLLQAGSLTVGGATTDGQIGDLSIDTGGTVLVSTITLTTGGVIDLNGGVLDPITMDVTGAGMIGGSGALDANVAFAASGDSLTYSNPGGTLEIVGSITGAGTLILATSSDILLDTVPDGAQSVQFGPGTETLILGTPALDTTDFVGVTGVGLGDMIDFGNGVTITAVVSTPGTSGEDVTLTVSRDGTIGTITFDDVTFTGGATHFKITTDSTTGDAAIEGAPCYAAGTRIATARGEIAIEDLRVGDLVRTVLDGAETPIIWIGRREVDCANHPKPRKVWPVRVAAGAFGPAQPHTDLLLSPDHAVYVNDVLIPIRYLVNGSTITQVPVDRITYHHIELPRHDVVLAEGLPAESFLDIKDGSNYANRAGPVRLYPDYTARMWEAFGCARLVVTGPELAAVRALIGGFAEAQAA